MTKAQITRIEVKLIDLFSPDTMPIFINRHYHNLEPGEFTCHIRNTLTMNKLYNNFIEYLPKHNISVLEVLYDDTINIVYNNATKYMKGSHPNARYTILYKHDNMTDIVSEVDDIDIFEI